MKLLRQNWAVLFSLLLGIPLHAQQLSNVQVKTANGVLEGVVSADGKSRSFKGIPYAAPPVGSLRWRTPQPASPWTGVRKATDFEPHAMQGHPLGIMTFRDAGQSEDCLYLNLWIPDNSPAAKLPVMVWIHGGGFVAGAASEPRQDGLNLSQKGVIVVSMNYRLGVFGFFAHPELTKESGHNASGNYGFLDQVAALQWVKDNIAAFGGDPDNVTIFGESAGSFSVSALMASPLARGLFNRAIGESGAFLGDTLRSKSRIQAEEAGVKFEELAFGTNSLEVLRAAPAKELLAAAERIAATAKAPTNYFSPDIDGYFLPSNCLSIYAAGKQSHIPLLAGWNLDEGFFEAAFSKNLPTAENYAARAQARYGTNADAFLKAYPATNDAQGKRAAQDLVGDKFIAHSTWRWIEMQLKTGGTPVFRYEFDQTLPLAANARPGTQPTAPHSCEIEYVFRDLPAVQLPWRQEDRDVSELMSSYWVNFAKTGDPNGPGLPLWPAYNSKDGYQVMHLQANSAAAPDDHRVRYEFLDHLDSSP